MLSSGSHAPPPDVGFKSTVTSSVGKEANDATKANKIATKVREILTFFIVVLILV